MTAPAFRPSPTFAARVAAALAEDLGPRGDVTSDAVFGPDHQSRATIVAKAHGVVCGVPVVEAAFAAVHPAITVEAKLADGDRVEPGVEAFALEGPTRALLAGERTALNFLQRLSGIASLTAAFVEAAGPGLSIVDTRKTTPLWRDLEKYAVACGGGTNHRFGLYDMVMLKDTHADGAGGLANALAAVRPLQPGLKVAAEARNLDEVRAAIDGGADLLMLDNMDDATLRAAVGLAKGRVPIEVTGGVTLETVSRFAGLGIDRVSVGALTHSAKALDFSMRLRIETPPAA